MRRKMQVCLQRMEDISKERQLNAYVRSKNNYVFLRFRIKYKINISSFYYYLPLDGFEYLYLKLIEYLFAYASTLLISFT